MEIFEIMIVGVVASLLMETIKKAFGSGSMTSRVITVCISVVLGTLYVVIRQSEWWETILSVLGMSSTFYAFFLKK